MSIHHSERMPNQATVVREVYREYLEGAKSLLVFAETSSTKEWPDRKDVLRNVFRLQILYNERESLRFEYLLKSNTSEVVTWKSLTRINERLLKEWTEAEEAGLYEDNLPYREVLRGIEDLEGKTDSPALNEPFQALTRNASYQDARRAFAKKTQQLNKKLSL